MVCGGFTCSKNALAALNVLYIVSSSYQDFLLNLATFNVDNESSGMQVVDKSETV